MTYIKWDPSFSVGVEELDEQHQQLLHLMNKLYESMRHADGEDALTVALSDMESVSAALNVLQGYVIYHFETEEKHMRELQYPDYGAHKELHEVFASQVQALKGRFNAAEPVRPAEVMGFLVNWFRTHVLRADKKYGPFFNQRGLY